MISLQLFILFCLGVDYFRPVLKRDRSCMVHWWFYPESYDTWIPDINMEYDVEDSNINREEALIVSNNGIG